MIRLMKCRTDEWRPSFCLSWIPLDLNDRKTAMPKPRLSRELPQWNEIQPRKRGSSWRNRSHVPSSLDRQREWTRYFYELIARGTRRRFLQGEGLAKVRHQQRSPAVPVRLSPPYWDELARRGSMGGVAHPFSRCESLGKLGGKAQPGGGTAALRTGRRRHRHRGDLHLHGRGDRNQESGIKGNDPHWKTVTNPFCSGFGVLFGFSSQQRYKVKNKSLGWRIWVKNLGFFPFGPKAGVQQNTGQAGTSSETTTSSNKRVLLLRRLAGGPSTKGSQAAKPQRLSDTLQIF